FTIARNLALRYVQRGKLPRGVGGTDMLNVLHNLPDPEHKTIVAFDNEYRNEIFHWAAARARGEFQDQTWQAFWRTCVLHEPIAAVAADLKMSMGNMYVARSRIIARLRRLVEDC